jgi:citrate lyase subunit beta / citryl-CoA lyase
MVDYFRPARSLRSFLFVPGNRPSWMLKATKYGADALIFDLEDSVPISEKIAARRSVGDAIDELSEWSGALFVRINPWRSGLLISDLLEVVRPGLTGVVLPKPEAESEVAALDLVLGELEVERGLPTIEIIPVLETPRALYRVFQICDVSDRVLRVTGVGGSDITGGDLTRALGVPMAGNVLSEMLHLNSRGIVEARAAGVKEILNGSTSDLADMDKVRAVALQAKRMAATGTMVIHPSHVPIVNEVFSPSPEEIAEAGALLRNMADAIANSGTAASTHNGRMADYAHVRSSLELLDRARSFGLDTGEVPDVAVH